jgi:integrase
VWQAQIIHLGFKPQYHTFDTKDEAEAWSRRAESEMDAGAWQDRSEGDRTSLADALRRYGREITPRKAPAQRERFKIKRMRRCSLAHIALSRLTGRDVADYIREREGQKIKSTTVLSELATLSHLYTVVRSAWGMPYLLNPVPLAKAARPKLPVGRERRPHGDEENRLLAAASPEFAAVIRFALATAMRRSEIAAMRWEHVDLKRRAVLLPKTKNGEVRDMPLSPVALEVFGSLLRRIDGSVLGASTNAISLAWKRTVKKAGITGLTFHDLRHEAISRLFEDTDLDMMEIRAISGHKTLQMPARYTHLRTHRLADRLAEMGRTESAFAK